MDRGREVDVDGSGSETGYERSEDVDPEDMLTR